MQSIGRTVETLMSNRIADELQAQGRTVAWLAAEAGLSEGRVTAAVEGDPAIRLGESMRISEALESPVGDLWPLKDWKQAQGCGIASWGEIEAAARAYLEADGDSRGACWVLLAGQEPGTGPCCRFHPRWRGDHRVRLDATLEPDGDRLKWRHDGTPVRVSQGNGGILVTANVRDPESFHGSRLETLVSCAVVVETSPRVFASLDSRAGEDGSTRRDPHADRSPAMKGAESTAERRLRTGARDLLEQAGRDGVTAATAADIFTDERLAVLGKIHAGDPA